MNKLAAPAVTAPLSPTEKSIRRYPDFLTVWRGQAVSVFGSQMTAFAISIWIYQQTGSVLQFGAVIAAQLLPAILCAPYAGVLVDRYRSKRVMFWCELGLVLTSALLYGLMSLQQLTPVSILFFSPVIALFSSTHQIAYSASIPQLVPRGMYGTANGYVQLAINGSAAIVPFISVYVLEALGLKIVLLLSIFTYSAAAVSLRYATFLEIGAAGAPSRARAGLKSLLTQHSVGVRYLFEQRNLLVLILFLCAVSFLNGIVLVLFRPMMLSTESATVLGWLVTIAGVGGLAGAALSGRISTRHDKVRTLLAASLVSGSTMLMCGWVSHYFLLAALVFVFSFSGPIILVTAQTLIQINTPAGLQGRIFAARAFFAGLALILAVVASPILTEVVFEPWMRATLTGSELARLIDGGKSTGMRAVFILAGAFMILLSLTARYSRHLQRLRRDGAAADRSQSTSLSV